ncbi:MAG: 50S ribosomal protein L29 [Phycisphaeraceae bacterium]|nr:50S ribosomal protein L29 [Phycisphaeraceae bacterium]
MKYDEVQNMSDEELDTEEKRLRKEIYSLRSQMVTEKLENPREIRNTRRDLARVLTESRSRQIQQEKA